MNKKIKLYLVFYSIAEYEVMQLESKCNLNLDIKPNCTTDLLCFYDNVMHVDGFMRIQFDLQISGPLKEQVIYTSSKKII